MTDSLINRLEGAGEGSSMLLREGDTIEIFPHPTIKGAEMCRVIRAAPPATAQPGTGVEK